MPSTFLGFALPVHQSGLDPAIVVGLMGVQVVEDNVDLPARCSATTQFMKRRNSTRRRRWVMAGFDQTGDHLQGRNASAVGGRRRRSLPGK